MKALLMIIGCLGVIGCASAAPKPDSYGIALTSRLAQPQFMTLEVGGRPFCAGEISAERPLQCEAVSQTPRYVKVVWGPPSSWSSPTSGDRALPPGWKVATGPTRQASLSAGVLHPPWWFRTGDVMVFTINRMHGLSVTYQCHRPGHACVSHPPVTIFGRPQGVAPLAR